MEMEEACIVSNCLTMQASSFAGRFFCLPRPPVVRARKPNLLALREVKREPRRLPGRLFWNSRPEVRARKPSLLALREVKREPRRHPGRLF